MIADDRLLCDRLKLTFTRVASHWCQKFMTSIQDGCCAIKANGNPSIDFLMVSSIACGRGRSTTMATN